jgi:hypothetical protein
LKKWALFSLVIGLFLSVLFPIWGFAETKDDGQSNPQTSSSLWDNLIPKNDLKKKVGKVEVKYNQVPLSYYQLDLYLENHSFWELTDKVSDTGHYFLHQFTNTFWQANVEVARIVIWVMEQSWNLDMVKQFGDRIGAGIQKLAGFDGQVEKRGFYGLFFPIMIVLLGSWVGWRAMVNEDDSGAMRGLMTAFLVIFGSYTFFYFASDIMKQANEASSEISKGVMAMTMNVAEPDQSSLTSDEATVQAGNNLWDIMVMKPYKLLQFGTTDVDDKRVDKVLKTPPDRRESVVQNEVQNLNNTNMTTQNEGTRLGFVLMVIFLNLVIDCVVIFISIGIPFFSLYFLFILMLAPIALTWAILPPWRNALYQWASHALGALLMKLALGVLMALYFAFSGALYDFAEEKGYLMTMLMQYILLGLIVWKRREIFQLVTVPATAFFGKTDSVHLLDQMVRKGIKQFDGKWNGKLPTMKNRKKKKPTASNRSSKPEPASIPTYEAEMVAPDPVDQVDYEFLYPDNELGTQEPKKLSAPSSDSIEVEAEPILNPPAPAIPTIEKKVEVLEPSYEKKAEVLEPSYERLPGESHSPELAKPIESTVEPVTVPVLEAKPKDEKEELPLLIPAEVKRDG